MTASPTIRDASATPASAADRRRRLAARATMRPRSTAAPTPSRSGGAAIGRPTRRGGAINGPVRPRLLLGGASRGIAADLRRRGCVAVGAGDGQLQHPRHAALAEDRIAEDLVVHVPPLGDEAGVLDVADDLDLVHAVARAGGADDVLLDHHAAHVVRAEGEAELADLAALRHPRRLQVVEVVEHEPRDRQRPQIVDAGRFRAAELGVLRLIAPGDERGEARRSRPAARAAGTGARAAPPPSRPCRTSSSPSSAARRVRVAHDAQPFVRGRLAVAVEQLAHAIDEDLGAAAGNAVEPGRDQPLDDLRHRQPRQPREVNDFGRRERVQPERRITLLHRAEQVLVPLERQVGIVPALQQQLTAAERDRLVDLPEDLVEAEDVAFGRSDRTVERAEVAARDADVRVVDVAIDDVGDDAVGMLAGADLVGQPAEQRRRRVQVELERLGAIEPSAAREPSSARSSIVIGHYAGSEDTCRVEHRRTALDDAVPDSPARR